ncbi:hypothetical protein Tco_1193634 [Tanacetum coccineum]
MEQAVEQQRLESKTFEVKINQVLNKNDRLSEQVISKDIVDIIVNSSVDNACVNVNECEKCLKLETELLNKNDFIEKEIYDKLKFFKETILSQGREYRTGQRESRERNRVHEETMQMLREMIKIQEEKRIFEEAARQEDEKRIATEKEAAVLEAKRKSKECLNIEEKSIPQASIRSSKL